MSGSQLFVGRHMFGVRQFTIESHDWPKCFSFGDEAQFSWRKVVIFTVSIHFRLLNKIEIIFEQIFDGETHDYRPNRFAIVENSRVLFLLFSAIEKAPQKTD